MNPHVNAIANRLSLRPPQRDSLEIIARVCQIIELSKDADPTVALAAIKSEFKTVEDFEREFPSLCFALATGVGKTRLMGAFIAYLHQAEGIRNFFVLAPNLTIYNKLIADFTPNTPKYVFKGIGEFTTTPPVVITGDNYESGAGVRGGRLFDDGVHVNIFNISKINSEVRGGSAPRIRKLSEYIGQSYFDYLAGLDDLVMLMDERRRLDSRWSANLADSRLSASFQPFRSSGAGMLNCAAVGVLRSSAGNGRWPAGVDSLLAIDSSLQNSQAWWAAIFVVDGGRVNRTGSTYRHHADVVLHGTGADREGPRSRPVTWGRHIYESTWCQKSDLGNPPGPPYSPRELLQLSLFRFLRRVYKGPPLHIWDQV